MHALMLQSCLTLCDPMDSSPPGSSVSGILQARILKWVAISSSRGSSQPMDQTLVSCVAGELFIAEPWWKDFFVLKAFYDSIFFILMESRLIIMSFVTYGCFGGCI